MEVKTDEYAIRYDAGAGTIVCEGALRLRGNEGYAEIVELLNQAADGGQESLVLDLRELQFLNSSGINALSKFVIRVRNGGQTRLSVQGSSRYPWQNKSLKNFSRLMPGLELRIVDDPPV